MSKITFKTAGLGVLAFVITGLVLGTRTAADDCVAFVIVKDVPCGPGPLHDCGPKNLIYEDPPLNLIPKCVGKALTGIYPGPFGCDSGPPPIQFLYAKCLPGWTVDEKGEKIAWKAACTKQETCVPDKILDTNTCKNSGIFTVNNEQRKASIHCIPGEGGN